MSRTRWALVMVVLAASLAQVIQTPARASRAPGEVLGLDPPAQHEVRMRADGSMVYRGPLTDRREPSRALDDLLADPSAASSAAMAEATRERAAEAQSSGGTMASSGSARAVSSRPQYLGSLPSLVGDVDGDAVGDVATVTRSGDGRVLDVRSGATSAVLWSRPTTDLTYAARVAGGPGFLVVSQRFEPGNRGLLRYEEHQVLVVEAINGLGAPAWRAEIRGTFRNGPLRSTVTDLPSVETVANVVGGDDDEVVLTLTSETRWRSGLRPPVRTSAVAVLDGATGTLQRGPAMEVHDYVWRWIEPFADLDSDGRLELIESRWTSEQQSIHILSGAGVEWWSDMRADRYWWVAPAGGDLDLDGVGDVMWLDYVLTCTGLPGMDEECTIDPTLLARSGRDGTVLATWDDAFPSVVGDVDRDGRTDLQLGRPVRDDEAGTFGLALSVEDITGRVIQQTTQSHALPEAPWEPWTSWGVIGDVDSDAIADTSWMLGRYERPSDPEQCPCVVRSEPLTEGRLSGATLTSLPPSPTTSWPVRLSFDGFGDDYFALASGEGTATASAFDGLNGGSLWSATVAVDHSSDYLSLSWADVDGDGGTDTLFGVHEPWETADGPEPRASYVLIDGATGAVRWRLDTGG